MKLLLTALLAINLFAMGEDTVESLHLCQSKTHNYLVTVVSALDDKNDRVIFINNYDALHDDTQEYMLPIQDPKFMRTTASITSWMRHTFNTQPCRKLTDVQVQAQLDKQLKD